MQTEVTEPSKYSKHYNLYVTENKINVLKTYFHNTSNKNIMDNWNN
jgi:hypothetical protein